VIYFDARAASREGFQLITDPGFKLG